MRKSTTASSNAAAARGFTLLEVMVSVAILAIAIVPMLFLREDSFNKAIKTKAERMAQQLAQQLLSQIALEVRAGTHHGEFEGWSDYQYEYTVTIYDFGSSFGDEDFYDEDDRFYNNDPDDSVYLDEDLQSYGPMVMRHVELIVTYPNFVDEEGGDGNEYIVDTYMPLLMTEEQFERQYEEESEE
ncbi:MAG: type IV pilus modification PilV family protein [Planctomycetota bacterium]|jgi:prepilin-type N-terminal cleavage/methylation domain-containing protein